jgi:catechol 2,3-dioxygenase-like lactoylglutathione lyase family enzyme
MKFTGVNHLAMATGDMDATIRFWRDLLGMRMVAGLGKPGFRHYFFEISPQDLIAFFEWPDIEPVPAKVHGSPVTGPFIFDHISFGVENSEDLWALKDQLEAAGFPCTGVKDHGFIHSIYAHDPNGIPIEFSWPVDGIDVRKKPRMADTDPGPLAREGAEPVPGRWPQVTSPSRESDKKIVKAAGSELFHCGKCGDE